MRLSVSMVMRLPSRNRCTSLPSLTALRPNVVSAISAWRQKSEIWLRIWSFFIGPGFWGKDFGKLVGRADRASFLTPSAQRGNVARARAPKQKSFAAPENIRDGDVEGTAGDPLPSQQVALVMGFRRSDGSRRQR